MGKREFGRGNVSSCGRSRHSWLQTGTQSDAIVDCVNTMQARRWAVKMTDPGRAAIVDDADGEGLCSSVEMMLVVQTMSYINYELLIEWFWQMGRCDVIDDVIMELRVPRGY